MLQLPFSGLSWQFSGDPYTYDSCLSDKYHLSHPTAIPPHVRAVSSAVCYYDNKATQN